MSLADSFGVMPDCKQGVNNPSTNLFTTAINGLFTVPVVGNNKQTDPVAEFAIGLGKKKYGSVAAFSVALFDEDKRQQVGQWLYRGVPSNQQVNVARKLDLTVEQLLGAGKIPVPDDELPAEALSFAREWLALPPLIRAQIQALIRSLPKDQGRVDREAVKRPELQQRRSA